MQTGTIKTIGVLAGVMALTAAANGHATTITIYDTLNYYGPGQSLIDTFTATPATEAAATAIYGFPMQLLPDLVADPTLDGPLFNVLNHGVATNTVGVKADNPVPGSVAQLAFLNQGGPQHYTGLPTVEGGGAPVDLTSLLAPALRSAGYTATLSASGAYTEAVPEPATWTMMLLGVGGLGAVLRRRRAMGLAGVVAV